MKHYKDGIVAQDKGTKSNRYIGRQYLRNVGVNFRKTERNPLDITSIITSVTKKVSNSNPKRNNRKRKSAGKGKKNINQ